MEGEREVVDYPWFTREFLRKQKKQMRHLYWPQMHLDTRPRDDRMFVPPYPIWAELPEAVEYYIGFDPSTGTGADSTGITVGAVDAVNTTALYLVESGSFMLRHEELASKALDLIVRYNPVRIGIEGVYFETLIPLIRMQAQERFKSVGEFPMPEFFKVSHGGGKNADAKWQKIDNSFGAMLRDGRILFGQGGMRQLRTEMDLYDKHKQKNEDDTIDSVNITIATIPYFSYGDFKNDDGTKVAQKQTWKALVEGLNKSRGGDRERMFAN